MCAKAAWLIVFANIIKMPLQKGDIIKTHSDISSLRNFTNYKAKTDIEKAVKYAQSSYDLGLVDLMYLLNAQQQLHNISLQENKILSDRYKNKIDLILSLGGRLDYE